MTQRSYSGRASTGVLQTDKHPDHPPAVKGFKLGMTFRHENTRGIPTGYVSYLHGRNIWVTIFRNVANGTVVVDVRTFGRSKGRIETDAQNLVNKLHDLFV